MAVPPTMLALLSWIVVLRTTTVDPAVVAELITVPALLSKLESSTVIEPPLARIAPPAMLLEKWRKSRLRTVSTPPPLLCRPEASRVSRVPLLLTSPLKMMSPLPSPSTSPLMVMLLVTASAVAEDQRIVCPFRFWWNTMMSLPLPAAEPSTEVSVFAAWMASARDTWPSLVMADASVVVTVMVASEVLKADRLPRCTPTSVATTPETVSSAQSSPARLPVASDEAPTSAPLSRATSLTNSWPSLPAPVLQAKNRMSPPGARLLPIRARSAPWLASWLAQMALPAR